MTYCFKEKALKTRRMQTICDGINGMKFEQLFDLCKTLYPRRKYKAFSKGSGWCPIAEKKTTLYCLIYNVNDFEMAKLEEVAKANGII